MAPAVFANHLDVIHFFYGLALAFLAFVAQMIGRDEEQGLPWKWLWSFGFLYALDQWVGALSLGHHRALAFNIVDLSLMFVSLLLLAEFGRGTCATLRGACLLGRWMLLPVVALSLVGAVRGFSGLELSVRTVLPLMSGTWAAYALARYRERYHPRSRALFAAVLGLAAFAAADGVSTAISLIFPSFRIPVELTSGLALLLTAFGLWRHALMLHQRLFPRSDVRVLRRFEQGMVIALGIILAASFTISEVSGRRADLKGREQILQVAGGIAAAIDRYKIEEVIRNRVDQKSPAYGRLHEQLTEVASVVPDLRYLYLLAARGEEVYFLIDTEPKQYRSPDIGVHTGLPYEEASGELRSVFATGRGDTEGPLPDQWGVWVSAFAPILDPESGGVMAVLGIDVDARDWAYLIDRERVAVIAVTMLFSVVLLAFSVAWMRSREWGDVLERKNTEIERLSAVQSAFTSMVSHELRTPLGAVKNAVEVVTDGVYGGINEQQMKALQIARRNIDRLTNLLNDVLDYSRIEAGRMSVNRVRQDLCPVASEVYRAMKSVADEKGLEFVLEPPSCPLEAVFDADRVSQVLYNLVSNAFKFTPSPGRVVLRVAPGGLGVSLSVSDTGWGIDPEEQGRVFEPFVQAHNQERSKEHGTGLGLAITRQIAELHHGRIDLTSAPGHGSTFTLTFPADLPEEQSIAEE